MFPLRNPVQPVSLEHRSKATIISCCFCLLFVKLILLKIWFLFTRLVSQVVFKVYKQKHTYIYVCTCTYVAWATCNKKNPLYIYITMCVRAHCLQLLTKMYLIVFFLYFSIYLCCLMLLHLGMCSHVTYVCTQNS